MTIGDYYALTRDPHGRAWVNAHCWIEQAAGRFCLNTPTGEEQFLASDDLSSVQAIAEQVRLSVAEDKPETEDSGVQIVSTDDAESDAKPHSGEVWDEVDDFQRSDVVADQFDDFHGGGGGWPGPNADDVEPGDFEDSLGEPSDDDDSEVC